MQPHAAPLEEVQRLLGVLIALYGLLIALLALGAFWIRAKFFTPLKSELTETAMAIRGEMTTAILRLDVSIEREAAARTLAIAQGAAATSSLTAAVRALDITCTELKVGAIREAEERGRQAERLHQLANHLTKVDAQLGAHLHGRRSGDPKDSEGS